MHKLLASLLLLLLSACQTVPRDAPSFTPAPPAPPGYGTLYLYRLDAPPYTGLIYFSVSERRIFAAQEQAYTWVHIKAGEHSVFAEWPAQPGWKSPPAAKVKVTEGASTYVRAEGAVKWRPPSWTTPAGINMNSMLTLIPPERASAELVVCCRYVRPFSSTVE